MVAKNSAQGAGVRLSARASCFGIGLDEIGSDGEALGGELAFF